MRADGDLLIALQLLAELADLGCFTIRAYGRGADETCSYTYSRIQGVPLSACAPCRARTLLAKYGLHGEHEPANRVKQ